MKTTSSIIIPNIIGALVISMYAFQPVSIESNNNIPPTATPSPRKITKSVKAKIYEEKTDSDIAARKRQNSTPRKKGKNKCENIFITERRKPQKRKHIIFDDTSGSEKLTRRKQIRRKRN